MKQGSGSNSEMLAGWKRGGGSIEPSSVPRRCRSIKRWVLRAVAHWAAVILVAEGLSRVVEVQDVIAISAGRYEKVNVEVMDN